MPEIVLTDTACDCDPPQNISTDRHIRWAVADYLRHLADRVEVGRVVYVHVQVHSEQK